MRSFYSTIGIGFLYCLTIFGLLGMALRGPADPGTVAGDDRPASVAAAHTPRMDG